jgi:hypothetical protein
MIPISRRMCNAPTRGNVGLQQYDKPATLTKVKPHSLFVIHVVGKTEVVIESGAIAILGANLLPNTAHLGHSSPTQGRS